MTPLPILTVMESKRLTEISEIVKELVVRPPLKTFKDSKNHS
jgi:hypothetical protein